ncbi:hypothetical protein BDN70DRAFT_990448, partial [Pholiota conissans]
MALADAPHDALRKDTHDSSCTVTPTTPRPKPPLLLEPTPSHDLPGPSSHKFYLSESDRPVYGQFYHASSDDNHAPQDADVSVEPREHQEQTHKSLIRFSGKELGPYWSPPDTPAQRTGPPRSLSFAYALPASPSLMSNRPSQSYFQHVTEDQLPADTSLLTDLEADHVYSFNSPADEKDFRGALEYRDQQERELRMHKRRQHRRDSGSWDINPMKWFQESPKEEKPGMDFPGAPSVSDAHAAEILHEEPEEGLLDAAHSEPEGSATSSFFLRRSPNRGGSADPSRPPSEKPGARLRRAFSVPHVSFPSPSAGKEKEKEGTQQDGEHGEQGGGVPMSPTTTAGTVKWAKLRALLPHLVHPQESILPGPSQVTSQAVNITDELITGGLSTLMLRLWIERDEKGQRRIPILFHRLRIRITDSLHPMERHASVFRIECEYANGAARWVVYRELKDFLSLHAHYTVSNIYNQNVDKMPEFPRTSLPYFKFLKKEIREKGDGTKVDRADFARLQREALENYLIELIRAVMFHPSSNRLAGFLEISALSIALAQSGGAQYKAGLLRIEADSTGGGGFGRKSISWGERKNQRWCAVRESYLVVLEEPGELVVWDVFLLDSDFKIERPKRYYRQGLGNLLHPSDRTDDVHANLHHRSNAGATTHSQNRHSNGDAADTNDSNANANTNGHASTLPHIHLSTPKHAHDSDCRSIISSIRTRVSKIFHLEPSKGSHASAASGSRRHASSTSRAGGTATASSGHSDNDADADDETSSAASSRHSSRPATPMLDPSTNANPLVDGAEGEKGEGGQEKGKEDVKGKVSKKVEGDVSKHTFYVVNSQMRLKLIAKNE